MKFKQLNEKNNLKTKEAEALRDLEELIGKPIPRVESLNEYYFDLEDTRDSNFRVKIDGDHITKLMLDGKVLEKRAKRIRKVLDPTGFCAHSYNFININYRGIIYVIFTHSKAFHLHIITTSHFIHPFTSQFNSLCITLMYYANVLHYTYTISTMYYVVKRKG